jgi:N-carbamoylputrescine amidase
MHIPMILIFMKIYFTPGDLGFKTIPTKKRKNRNLNLLGSMVPRSGSFDCFARCCFTQQQLDGIHKKKSNMAKTSWRLMSVMKGHAVANGVYVAAANRIGLEQ